MPARFFQHVKQFGRRNFSAAVLAWQHQTKKIVTDQFSKQVVGQLAQFLDFVAACFDDRCRGTDAL